MNRIVKSLGLLSLSAVFVAVGMALLPVVLSFSEKPQMPDEMISRARIRPSMPQRENPPEKRDEVRLRSVKAAKSFDRSRGSMEMKFTPDLAVGSESGAALQEVDISTALFEENEIDVPPKVKFIEPLRYPERARDAGIEGVVSMIIIVERDGRVKQVVFESLPHRLFRYSIESQVKRWRFEPGKNEGVPVRVKVRQVVEFFLD